ncbi:MAG: class I SAM-dependent RNA methyltransferase [Holophagales bacterium]|nr:class I SAM-dependent RNA methyltransferase [Holophagales bacterium]
MPRELTVERVVPGGSGLGRLDGAVTLVSGGLPGDRLLVDPQSDGPRLVRADVVSVIEPGPHRRPEEDVCPRARDGSCGGCDWPALRLESHGTLKEEILRDALRRIGRVPDAEVPQVRFVPSPRSYRLRSRLRWDGRGALGFVGKASSKVSDLVSCEVVSETLLSRLPAVREALAGARVPECELQTLEGRRGAPLLGELRFERPVPAPERIAAALQGPLDGVRVVVANRLAGSRGPAALEIEAGGARFRVSVSSFFQANRFLLDAFLDEARSVARAAAAEGTSRGALDLYAGAGFLTRPLLESGFDTDAVESDPSSSADLASNLASWRAEGLPGRGRAVATDVETHVSRMREPFDVVFADPPREGLSPVVRQALLRIRPRSLFLVSCDPATFARDLAALLPRLRVRSLTLLDLFPGTHHVETLAELERRP